MFKDYESRPITRKAVQLDDYSNFYYDADTYSWYFDMVGEGVLDDYKWFAVSGIPESGGWIVYLNDDDIYYCSDKVFRERNVV